MEEKNEKSKKGLIVTLVVIIVLLLGACGYLLYDKLNTKDNNEVKPTPSATPTNTPSPSPSTTPTNSPSPTSGDNKLQNELMKMLDIPNNGYTFTNLLFKYLDDNNNILTLENIPKKYMNYLGYLQLKSNNKVRNIECSSLKKNSIQLNNFENYGEDYTFYCMRPDMENYPGENESTYITESDLKIEVEKIFGIGSYVATNYFFNTNDLNGTCSIYYYDEDDKINGSNIYVLNHSSCGGMSGGLDIKSTTLEIIGDTAVLTQKLSIIDIPEDECKLIYTFKKDGNNYIFSKIERVN